jgi:predicted metal-dependent peptidase
VTAHTRRASIALRMLGDADPALAALSLWCQHRDTDTGPAATTSGDTILYGPPFESLPRHEQAGLCAHHILHVALCHPARLADMALRQPQDFSADLWTLAADAIVNEAVLAAGHALPRPAVTLSDLVADGGEAALADWDVERLYLHLAGSPEGRGRAEGIIRRMAFTADVTPEAGATDSADQTAAWRGHVVRAMEAGRMAGRGLGLIGHRLADIPRPEVPWEIVLRSLVTRAVTAGAAPDWRRPARGWIAADAAARATGTPGPAFLPGTNRRQEIARIGIGLDTSSSIDDLRWRMFSAEITGIARRTGAELIVIPFDESPEPPLRLGPGEGLSRLALLDTRRGGGTDFRPLLQQAQSLALSILVILTDLEGETGPAPRGLPVIWALPPGAQTPAPWGKRLSLER